VAVAAFRNIVLAVIALALAAPASAQLYSDGYKFLQAVKNREGTEATEMLNAPGSTVINARDLTSGETGLHLTIARRDLVWTRWLLQQGGNPNIADNQGATPLIRATEIGFLEGVEALIAGGAQVDIANRTGETPLIAAVHTRNIALMQILLRAGADPDRTDNAGRSARMYASERGGERALAAIEETASAASGREQRNYGPVF
jgi:ankyrin repeat protein